MGHRRTRMEAGFQIHLESVLETSVHKNSPTLQLPRRAPTSGGLASFLLHPDVESSSEMVKFSVVQCSAVWSGRRGTVAYLRCFC
jgi:hypothetical protein